MSGFELAAAGLVVGLAAYLFWALLFPEDLS
ncbi:MAG: potassium-transporting ATPase subunit F [Comamonadaceae bacterium]|jgi:K+-transporting ATPase KdpF subunit|nr:potassium-transporting ATPase subunit F [Comamonadaceae bacterium]